MSREISIEADTGAVVVTFPFDLALKDRVKALPGARFHWGSKSWRFPAHCAAAVIEALRPEGFTVVGGDPTPASVPTGDPERQPRAELPNDPQTADRDTFSISALNAAIGSALQRVLPAELWFSGVLAEYDRGRHRDTSWARVVEETADGRAIAAIGVVIFPAALRRIKARLADAGIELTDGLPIRLRGRVDFYAPRGTLQVVVEDVDPAFSIGDLAMRREELLRALRTDRLDRLQLERPMPPLPRRVALVTSVGSDAWHDVLSSLRAAALPIEVVPYDVRVQGPDLRTTVCAALEHIRKRGAFDLVLITRGGGSRVDLATWDDDAVARAVATLPVKVLVAIGHHQDRSVLDEIAESAKTPTEAGERIVGLWDAADRTLERAGAELERRVRHRLEREHRALDGATRRAELGARNRIARHKELLAAAAPRLAVSVRARLRYSRQRFERLEPRISAAAVNRAVTRRREGLMRLVARLERAARTRARTESTALAGLSARVRLAHPDNILARGYAIVRAADGAPLSTAHSLSPGDAFSVSMRDGVIEARVANLHLQPKARSGSEEEGRDD